MIDILLFPDVGRTYPIRGKGTKKVMVVEEWNWESAVACVSVFAANPSHGVINLHIFLWLCVLAHWGQHHKKPALSLSLVVQLLHTCFSGAGDNLSYQRCLPHSPTPICWISLPSFPSRHQRPSHARTSSAVRERNVYGMLGWAVAAARCATRPVLRVGPTRRCALATTPRIPVNVPWNKLLVLWGCCWKSSTRDLVTVSKRQKAEQERARVKGWGVHAK